MKKKFNIFAVLMALLLVLAACSSQSGSSGETAEEGSSGEGADTAGAKVEIFSWWTAGGEADALKAFIEQFNKKYPDIEVVNAAVAGGAGTNAKALLATRMQGGDPPSSFQVHAGAELMTWVNAGKMAPLNDLYEKNGWEGKFPEQLIEMESKDGKIYGVPIDIHRGNVVWYNKKVFEENNLQPPETFEEFFRVAEKLKANGITPLALGDKNVWPATMLFENIVLGKMGAENYTKLWNGEISFDDPAVRESVETFKKMLDYVNDDHSSRAWQDASQLVADGEAAMNVMGDWAKGYFTSKGLKPKEDYGWIETPGSLDSFMIVNDTFGLPKDVKNPEAVKKFLSFVGSIEGQDTFNPLKGSIPARTDTDKSKYDVYSKEAMKDFETLDLAPSVAHGSAVPEGVLTKVNQAVNIFVTQKDVDQFINALKQATSQMK